MAAGIPEAEKGSVSKTHLIRNGNRGECGTFSSWTAADLKIINHLRPRVSP